MKSVLMQSTRELQPVKAGDIVSLNVAGTNLTCKIKKDASDVMSLQLRDLIRIDPKEDQ